MVWSFHIPNKFFSCQLVLVTALWYGKYKTGYLCFTCCLESSWWDNNICHNGSSSYGRDIYICYRRPGRCSQKRKWKYGESVVVLFNITSGPFLRVLFVVYESSPPELFLGKDLLKIFSKFTVEHPCWSVISIRLLCNFIEIALGHQCYPVNLLHIFRTPFYKNTFEGLLLLVTGWRYALASHIIYKDIVNKSI